MRILCVISPIYDYLTATVIEGLTAEGHEVRCTEASNHGVKIADADVRAFAETADLIVIGSNERVRTDLVQSVANPAVVFIDGRDDGALGAPDRIRLKAVFKRELSRLYRHDPARRIEPLPFAAEHRYFPTHTMDRDITVSFLANLRTNPMRYSIAHRLAEYARADFAVGTTGERAYDPKLVPGDPQPTPLYQQMLARSRISISVPGAGYDCARYWEILAAGALLFSYEPDIWIPEGFTDGVDCVTFNSLAEFDEKLAWLLQHPEDVELMAKRGHERALEFHTTRARARWFLHRAMPLVARPGYAAEWLHPEIRALEPLCVGRGIDVGCGSSKTTPECIGVDLTAGGTLGQAGCEEGRSSAADVVASGDALGMFGDGELDFVVARHNLEHYHDPSRALAEWRRVVRPGGRIGVVVPDHDRVDTYALDPTHYCHFTARSLAQLATSVGLRVEQVDVCVPDWSLMGIFTRVA